MQALVFTNATGSPFTLTSAWQLVCRTGATTKGLIISATADASAYDIEWVAVNIGNGAPTDSYGACIGLAENFATGLPIGDIYCKSASGQKAVVRLGG